VLQVADAMWLAPKDLHVTLWLDSAPAGLMSLAGPVTVARYYWTHAKYCLSIIYVPYLLS
jgi:hypothetical protein